MSKDNSSELSSNDKFCLYFLAFIWFLILFGSLIVFSKQVRQGEIDTLCSFVDDAEDIGGCIIDEFGNCGC